MVLCIAAVIYVVIGCALVTVSMCRNLRGSKKGLTPFFPGPYLVAAYTLFWPLVLANRLIHKLVVEG